MSSEFASANLTVGQINAIVKKLGGEDGAMKFLRGELIVQLVKHVIDCDAAPFCPEGWKVESHKKGGQLEWSAEKISLYLSAGQKNGKWIVGNELRKELENQSVLNANVLDYLLAHPEVSSGQWSVHWANKDAESGRPYDLLLLPPGCR